MTETEAGTVNIPLLRKAVEWAEAEAAKPEIDCQWAQDSWVTAPRQRARDLLHDTSVDMLPLREQKPFLATLAPHCGTAYCIAGYIGQMLDARYATADLVDDVHVSEFAIEALGLGAKYGCDEAEDSLFAGGNSIADVRRIAEDLAGERL